jgi:hypothetical protein
LEELALRYLGAFGPASVADFQAWSGLTHMREIMGRIESQLIKLQDDNGVELFDLPAAPRPDAETLAPVRFVPEFDNITLSHTDRRRIISEDDRKTLATLNGIVPGSVLVDGFVHASWKITRSTERPYSPCPRCVASRRRTPHRSWPRVGGCWPWRPALRLPTRSSWRSTPLHRIHDRGHQRPLISSQPGGEPGSSWRFWARNPSSAMVR